MAHSKMHKTNVMRMLDAAHISYEVKTYDVDKSDLSGHHVAKILGQDEDQIFKTLVLSNEHHDNLVCCIPSSQELDLKKVARAAQEKKVEMLHMKDLFATTGYVRGGCSPIGMKKAFPTYIDETAQLWDQIAVSGGQRGVQIIINPTTLIEFCSAKVADLVAI